jgi:hypothetical protein
MSDPSWTLAESPEPVIESGEPPFTRKTSYVIPSSATFSFFFFTRTSRKLVMGTLLYVGLARFDHHPGNRNRVRDNGPHPRAPTLNLFGLHSCQLHSGNQASNDGDGTAALVG